VLRIPISRQLRTGYSRVVIDPLPGESLRALVVGDPGAGDDSLPGARDEAVRVAATLEGLGVDVAAYIGASGDPRGAELADIPPATRLEVLGELLSGRYDLVHYSGHGTLNTQAPELPAGWVFADGLITARELSQLAEAPRMVVANACYTSVLSAGDAAPPTGTGPQSGVTSQAALVPGLADEFLRAGAVHYLGTAWPVNDTAGVAFAEAFYAALVGDGTSVGAAVCAARRAAYARREEWGTTWAAYQHYGDPTDCLRNPADGRAATGEERR
jgi:hypothetical protein